MFSPPALGAECRFFAPNGDTVDINEGDLWVTFNWRGLTQECELGPNGRDAVAYCDFGEVFIHYPDPDAVGEGATAEILGETWVYRCYEPA